MLKMYKYNKYIELNEGGNAFDDVDVFRGDEKKLIEPELIKFCSETLDIDDSKYSIVGSFNKKKPDENINDVDICVLGSSLVNNSMKTFDDSKEVVSYLESIFNDKNIENNPMLAIGVISIKLKIEERYLQVDIIPVADLDWGEFSYFSPPVDKSDYKGLYRNALFEAIAKSIHYNVEYYTQEETTKYINDGDIKSYWRYRYTRNLGLFKVKEYNKGVRVFDYVKDRNTYELVTNNPREVINKLIGHDIKMYQVYTYDMVYDIITKKTYKYYHLLDTIFENFRIIIEDRQNNELPENVKKYLKL